MSFLDTLRRPVGDLLRGMFTAQQPATPVDTGAVDEYGRSTAPSDPSEGIIFMPRTIDRLSAVNPPWTPEQIAHALRAAENGDLSAQSELFEHMEERDGALSGFMSSRRLKPCGLKWSCEPSDDDDAEAVEIAAFVEREIRNIPNFDLGLRDMFDAVGKSMSLLNVNWQRGGRSADTSWRIDGIDWINTKRVRFDWKTERVLVLPSDHNQVFGESTTFDQAIGLGLGVIPPPWSVIIHRSRTRTTHPARGGVLRVCAFMFLFRNYLAKDYVRFATAYGMPLRIGKYREGTSDEDKQRLALAVQMLGTDAAAIVSDQTIIELVEAKAAGGGGSEPPFDKARKAFEREMEISILGQEQTHTIKARGGQAQTESGGAKVIQDILEADCKDASASLSPQLCRPIVGVSKYGWAKAQTKCPRFRFHYEPEQDYVKMIAADVPLHTTLGVPTTLGALAERYNQQLPVGIDPDTIVIYTQDLPPGVDESKVYRVTPALGAVADPAADPQNSDPEGDSGSDSNVESINSRRRNAAFIRMGMRFAARAASNANQRAIDDYGDQALEAGAKALASLPAAVQAILSEASSYDDAILRIRKAYDDLDTGAVDQIVERGAFVMRLFGRSTVRKAPKE